MAQVGPEGSDEADIDVGFEQGGRDALEGRVERGRVGVRGSAQAGEGVRQLSAEFVEHREKGNKERG